jgi:hypothetical protein
MSKYETGLHKGEEIMIACPDSCTWRDHWNNVFIEREFDADWKELDTFRIVERLRGNRHQIWVTGQSFENARDLAERLVIGKDYVPPRRSTPIPTEPEFSVGDVLPGDFHCHQITDRGLASLYDPTVMNLMEASEATGEMLRNELKGLYNKSAKILGISEDKTLLIAYLYDFTYYTGNLVRKEK